MSSSAPLPTYCQKLALGMPAMLRPVLKLCMSSTPMTVPGMLPTPPAKDTPPRMTAVMASNSRFTLAEGWPDCMRATYTMPPMEHKRPIITKDMVTMRLGFMPASRAAWALPPMA